MSDELEQLKAEHEQLKSFIESVRALARNRNPDGATILDFMTVWNEQYERANNKLRARVAELEAGLEPFAHYGERIEDESMPPPPMPRTHHFKRAVELLAKGEA